MCSTVYFIRSEFWLEPGLGIPSLIFSRCKALISENFAPTSEESLNLGLFSSQNLSLLQNYPHTTHRNVTYKLSV
jgi:hypothetical protein